MPAVRTGRLILATLVTGLVAAACSSNKSPSSACPGGTAPSDISAQVASVDLYTGVPQRVLVGIEQVQSSGTTLLSYGSIKVCMSSGPHKIDATSNYFAATGTNQASP